MIIAIRERIQNELTSNSNDPGSTARRLSDAPNMDFEIIQQKGIEMTVQAEQIRNKACCICGCCKSIIEIDTLKFGHQKVCSKCFRFWPEPELIVITERSIEKKEPVYLCLK